MFCKILAFFILPCLVISFKADIKPALKGNPCLFVCIFQYMYNIHTLEMSCLWWTGSSQIIFEEITNEKKVSFFHYHQILMKLSEHCISYSLKCDLRSISKITFYANLIIFQKNAVSYSSQQYLSLNEGNWMALLNNLLILQR